MYNYGDNIIKEIWEEISDLGYDCEIECGIESIKNVLFDSYNTDFSDVWVDFCSRNFFNGEYQTINDNPFFHEDQKDIISLLTYLSEPEHISGGEISTSLSLNNTSSKYIPTLFQKRHSSKFASTPWPIQ